MKKKRTKENLERSDGDFEGLSEILSVYFKRIKEIPLISRQEEIELGKRIRKGDADALKKLVEANLRFVVTIALKYKNFGLPLVDLISEGNVGLIQAAKRFDPEKNVKFISYAVWWIRQAILQALAEKGFSTKIPPKQITKLRKINMEQSSFLKKYGRIASSEELQESTGFSKKDIGMLSSIQKYSYSLDDKISPSSDDKFIDFIKSDTKSVEDQAIMKSAISNMKEAIQKLPERSRMILIRRYGLDGKKPATLREIGETLRISKERIRQIENEAIRKLKILMSNDR